MLLSKEEFVSFVKRLYELSAKEKKNPFSKLTVHTNRAMQFFGNCNELGGYHCGAGKNLAVIVANGDVLPCRRLPIVLGNLLEKDMITIWEENQEKVKEIHKLPEHCRSCIYVGKCRGGAKCLTYALYGNFKEKDYHCPV